MFPRENRLIQKKDFNKIHRSNSFFSFGIISLKIKKNKFKKTRVGFSIGVKFSPKAIERNRIKRQLREIIRKNLENIRKGFDIIILIKSYGKGFSSKKIEQDLIMALKKAKLI